MKGWRSEGFKVPADKSPEFECGTADFVPGRFMTGNTVDMTSPGLAYKMLRSFHIRGQTATYMSPQRSAMNLAPHF
jgi:hypothetical protein